MQTILNFAETSRSSALNTFTTERRVTLDCAWVEIREYDWRAETQDVWTAQDEYFIDLALTPRTGSAQATYVEGRFRTERLGRVMVVPPGHTIRSGCSAGKQRSLHCTLSSDFVHSHFEGPPALDDRALRDGLNLLHPEIAWILRKTYSEMSRPSFGMEVKVGALMAILAIELIRTLDLGNNDTRSASGGLAPWRLNLIRDRVYTDGPIPSNAELAQIAGLSLRHINRAFKAETGQTLGKFVEAAMVERAQKLLTETSLSIAEVARRVGYSTPHSFAYAFRRSAGLRPSDVRQGR